MTGGVSVRVLEGPGEERDCALHLALDAAYTAGGPPAPPVAELLGNSATQGLDASLVVAAYRRGQMAAACFLLESPGHTALLFVPTFPRGPLAEEAAVEALREVLRLAGERKLKILQALLLSEASGSARALARVGFRFLTRLVYLERAAGRPALSATSPIALRWFTCSAEREELFRLAIAATYVQTLDCPKLVGLRSMEEVLEGHRATGLHDPNLWRVAVDENNDPAGVLLLTHLPGRPALEVVYLGVAQPFRGQGVGDARMTCALRCCRETSATTMALAVDEANKPARRLYERWGFTRTGVRDAWIATPLSA